MFKAYKEYKKKIEAEERAKREAREAQKAEERRQQKIKEERVLKEQRAYLESITPAGVKNIQIHQTYPMSMLTCLRGSEVHIYWTVENEGKDIGVYGYRREGGFAEDVYNSSKLGSMILNSKSMRGNMIDVPPAGKMSYYSCYVCDPHSLMLMNGFNGEQSDNSKSEDKEEEGSLLRTLATFQLGAMILGAQENFKGIITFSANPSSSSVEYEKYESEVFKAQNSRKPYEPSKPLTVAEQAEKRIMDRVEQMKASVKSFIHALELKNELINEVIKSNLPESEKKRMVLMIEEQFNTIMRRFS